jgi:hypothetical protein
MFLLDLGLVVLIVIFAVRQSNVNHVQLQGDVTGFVPQFDHEITTFRAHPEFVSNHTSMESLQDAQKAWTEFLPRKLIPEVVTCHLLISGQVAKVISASVIRI